ncbi:helix-turn-helix transcriptional regulator [Chelatococcus reniformis]|uniref:Transcriptional regulator n=1 Tax=Chelatococcus reniformis TaxID=1494448 RepID=A0A916UYG6_9HYPH|nr:LuxR family transcriptional regulator [Chelatococcus reniformis]GGC93997.1 transcriptional regulator [Chelatococcus reniformis]
MEYLETALSELLDSLEAANSESEFYAAAERLARRSGFRWFAYFANAGANRKALSSYPRSWVRRYLDKSYEHLDPVIAKAQSTHKYFLWDSRATSVNAKAQRRFFDEAAEFGIRWGITLPIRSGQGRFAALTLAAESADAFSALSEIGSIELLQIAALYYHAHAHAKLQFGRVRTVDKLLTEREGQCLWWSAQGKTTYEIATILGISKRTVVFHLENARSKLQVSNITQAVAQALLRRLIGP